MWDHRSFYKLLLGNVKYKTKIWRRCEIYFDFQSVMLIKHYFRYFKYGIQIEAQHTPINYE